MISDFFLLRLVALPTIWRITSPLLNHPSLVTFVSCFSSRKFLAYVVHSTVSWPIPWPSLMSKSFHDSSKHFGSILMFNDVRYIKAIRLTNFIWLTLDHYLGSRLNILYSTFELAILSGKCPRFWQYEYINVPLSIDFISDWAPTNLFILAIMY